MALYLLELRCAIEGIREFGSRNWGPYLFRVRNCSYLGRGLTSAEPVILPARQLSISRVRRVAPLQMLGLEDHK